LGHQRSCLSNQFAQQPYSDRVGLGGPVCSSGVWLDEFITTLLHMRLLQERKTVLVLPSTEIDPVSMGV